MAQQIDSTPLTNQLTLLASAQCPKNMLMNVSAGVLHIRRQGPDYSGSVDISFNDPDTLSIRFGRSHRDSGARGFYKDGEANVELIQILDALHDKVLPSCGVNSSAFKQAIRYPDTFIRGSNRLNPNNGNRKEEKSFGFGITSRVNFRDDSEMKHPGGDGAHFSSSYEPTSCEISIALTPEQKRDIKKACSTILATQLSEQLQRLGITKREYNGVASKLAPTNRADD